MSIELVAAITIGFFAGILFSSRAMQKIKDEYAASGHMINRGQAYRVTKVEQGEE
ncbi:hypothetical protein SL040_000779 [Aeromonas salmonicida]|nr:hypothetical protein [Aeromonas salmonicida]ELY2003692.1 hypothetical protein [Aeromonas salmonicida]MCR4454267.1 hypothetical protein [Aeromonas salmonicida]